MSARCVVNPIVTAAANRWLYRDYTFEQEKRLKEIRMEVEKMTIEQLEELIDQKRFDKAYNELADAMSDGRVKKIRQTSYFTRNDDLIEVQVIYKKRGLFG